MTKLLKLLTSRALIVLFLILVQVFVLFLWIYRAAISYELMPLFQTFAIICVIYIINKQEDPSYKIAWAVFILTLPVIGGVLYVMCGGRKVPHKLFDGTTKADQRMERLLSQEEGVLDAIRPEDEDVRRVFQYGWRVSRLPAYSNTQAVYFEDGASFYDRLLTELRKAEHFIFLEFFIIEPGEMWNTVLEILREKIRQGVQVKLIYDDIGCAASLPYRYDKILMSYGIETYRFNPMRPALIIQMNNRDHRKIIVIDNRVGFTGGVNMADEYIGKKEKYGQWRDSALMIRGEAVWSLTDMFLGMYSFLKDADVPVDYEQYRLPADISCREGLFQPFSDTPTDGKYIGLSMHLNLVNHARKYLYIDTPYLVLNDDMLTALGLAASNGVDVRILVPHIPDKKYVFEITRSNYEQLLAAGVRIYEFTPGFNHSKNIVSDDRIALVGTVNTDYRSYYLHFEDGILIYDNPVIGEMKKDFLKGLEMSREITLAEVRKVPMPRRIFRGVLRLMAPLL